MDLGLLGFGVHGLNHCSVANPAEHIEKSGMGMMGKRHLHLTSVAGAGVGLSGSEWHVGEKV